jgi:hypothetical protein
MMSDLKHLGSLVVPAGWTGTCGRGIGQCPQQVRSMEAI